MRTDILALLARTYRLTRLAAATDAEIYAAGFVQLDHSARIRNICKKNNYIVTFRKAGADSLTRIGEGMPCKGHTIMNKSIKRKGGNWTYIGDAKELDTLKGLVGYPSDTDNTLAGIWCYNTTTHKKVKTPIKDVRLVANAFTGDYDMHDLLKCSGGSVTRILAGTPEESSAIDALNLGILPAQTASPLNQVVISQSDLTRRERVYERMTRGGHTDERSFKSAYALIRHGAQTSFVSYLLSHSGVAEIPEDIAGQHRIYLEQAVTKLDPEIVVYDNNKNAYLLDSIDAVYSFYYNNNLLNQIPFYYFFEDLRAKGVNLDAYTTQLNTLFGHHKIAVGL